jgi:hypothetical protein
MLHLYYTNLCSKKDKNKFIEEVMEKCMVGYPIVRTWISKPGSVTHRNPKAIYRPILAEITGIKADKLFRD